MIPELHTARLALRGITEADAPSIQRNLADDAVIGELAARVPYPYPPDGAIRFIREEVMPAQGRDRWVWAIFLEQAPAEAIGVIDLRRGEGENRGFWLARAQWGRGLMTEAAYAVTEYAFAALGFERLMLCNALGNTRSRRIKEKAGARLLRVEPFRFVNPDYTHHEVWELTKADWLRARQTLRDAAGTATR